MPFCANCGRENSEAEIFCPQCGTQRGALTSATSSSQQPSSLTAIYATAAISHEKPGARYIGSWNWGAAFLYPYWLMTHRRVPLGIILFVVSLIPFVNIIGVFCLFYFGIKGNRIAVESGRFTDEIQFVAVQNAWRNWSFAFIILGLLVGLIGLAASLSTHTR